MYKNRNSRGEINRREMVDFGVLVLGSVEFINENSIMIPPEKRRVRIIGNHLLVD